MELLPTALPALFLTSELCSGCAGHTASVSCCSFFVGVLSHVAGVIFSPSAVIMLEPVLGAEPIRGVRAGIPERGGCLHVVCDHLCSRTSVWINKTRYNKKYADSVSPISPAIGSQTAGS